MRINLTDSPRKIATVHPGRTFHIRVMVGSLLLANNNQDLLDGTGLPINISDGILHFQWDSKDVWMRGNAVPAIVEVIVP